MTLIKNQNTLFKKYFGEKLKIKLNSEKLECILCYQEVKSNEKHFCLMRL